MSKVRDLPQTTTLADDDLLYAVEFAAGPNGGRKIKKSDLKTSVAPTAAETKAAYESNPDTNAFTDAEKTKLGTVEAGAAFQDAIEVPYNNSTSGLSATEVQSAIDQVNTKAQADFRPSVLSGLIVHYSGGTARFDDVLYTVLAGDILLNTNITNGEVYVDLDGVVKQTASGITAPALSIVFAKFSTDLTSVLSLVDERVKNAQNLVRGLLADIRDVRAGAAAVAGASGRLSDAMHKHNILTGAPSSQTPNQANAEGTSTNLARADHAHQIATAAPTATLAPSSANADGAGTAFVKESHTHQFAVALDADVSTILPNDAAATGAVDKFAKAAHKHAIATAAPSVNLAPSSTNTEGAGNNFARATHTHAHDMSADGDVSTILPNDAASAGAVDKFSKAGHKHAVTTAAPVATGTANSAGTANSLVRSDHVHDTTISNSSVRSTTAAATTSATDVLITSMTLTPAAGTYLVMFEGMITDSTNSATTAVSLYIDTTQVTNSERILVSNAAANILSISTFAVVALNGSQAISARYRTSAGTLTANGRSLTLVRMSA